MGKIAVLLLAMIVLPALAFGQLTATKISATAGNAITSIAADNANNHVYAVGTVPIQYSANFTSYLFSFALPNYALDGELRLPMAQAGTGLTYDPSNNNLYILNSGSGYAAGYGHSIAVVNASTLKVVATIPVPIGTVAFTVYDHGGTSTIFVITNQVSFSNGKNALYMLSSSGSVLRNVSMPQGIPTTMAISASTAQVFVGAYMPSSTVYYTFNALTGKLAGNLTLQDAGFPASQPALIVANNGQLYAIYNGGGGSPDFISIISNGQLIKNTTFPTARQSYLSGVDINTKTNVIYIAMSNFTAAGNYSGYIAPVNLNTLSSLPVITLQAGVVPTGTLEVDSQNNITYITDNKAGSNVMFALSQGQIILTTSTTTVTSTTTSSTTTAGGGGGGSTSQPSSTTAAAGEQGSGANPQAGSGSLTYYIAGVVVVVIVLALYKIMGGKKGKDQGVKNSKHILAAHQA